ncbi:FHF complex subunit HOOK interacting protein 1A isoform X5 [Ictalurus furcatus]|uniref:FHF complex subunit HOOK interacting protein 1A isoform X5 n=1 Tax=Ictalurus furcatus TaxID=66913 RepID=UPI002350E6CE|nr:FHF complex subunit HOOK interacting protein 1A isoform X5 [Ictalurus furcatus]
MASAVANRSRGNQSLLLKGVDPETCMIVFKNHWAQVVKILEKHDPLRSGGGFSLGVGVHAFRSHGARHGTIPLDEASAVQNYVEHMLYLLMEEESGVGGAMGPILEFVIMENVMERLFVWSLRRDFTDQSKLEQLKMYEMLIGQAKQPLLHHKPILKPLMMLLSSCSGTATGQTAAGVPTSSKVEHELVLLLHQLCCVVSSDPSILELFFHSSEDQGAANFLLFSLLVPFIHRDGAMGQQARDALLLIMTLSNDNQRVAKHIAHNTFFCPVLATGLSGLYSSLPAKLEVSSEDWHCIQKDEWQQEPALVHFLNSLEFCNAVMQVAHPSIRDQLVGYIINGFLIPVLGPALHKLTLEEVMTTTAYLDLFLRTVTEPALLHTFLRFILLHRHDNVHILDTLVSRINTPFQLGTVSLALFRTLIGLYCEDVMLQLILKYLIPCNHMMLSQRCVLNERDCYSVSAAKFLALTPSCCSPDFVAPPIRQLDSITWSKVTDGAQSGTMETEACSSEQDDSGHSCVIGSEIHLDVSYLHYLYDARNGISNCIRACSVWSAPYDGVTPPPGDKSRPRVTSQAVTDVTSSSGVELEWDDSYDAGSARAQREEEEENGTAAAVPNDPPRHIQELRKTATLLVNGSYVEESEFQDDVLVYDLVAQKDANESADRTRILSDPVAEDAGVEKPDDSGEKSEIRNGSVQPDVEKQNGVHIEADPSAHDLRAEQDDDLATQYEELIRTLVVEVKSPTRTRQELRNSIVEEEDDVDFSSFSAETPEAEKSPSPFRTKPHTGSVNQAMPFTGPFVSVLLSRLENMLENSLHVNLLLTGIIAQLAAYPQPLLRSFLLNTNMVFQPSVRSLYQVTHLHTLTNKTPLVHNTKQHIVTLPTLSSHITDPLYTPKPANKTLSPPRCVNISGVVQLAFFTLLYTLIPPSIMSFSFFFHLSLLPCFFFFFFYISLFLSFSFFLVRTSVLSS